MFQFSVPTIAGLLSTALYNLADAWFVSQLGTEAGAAVGVAFPIQTLMQTVGFTLGLGGGSLLSRKLGEKKRDEAKSYAALAFWTSLLIGVAIAIAGWLWRLPLVRLLGAEEPVIPLSLSYVKYLLWAAPVMCASFVMGQLLRAKGHVWLSAIGISIGNILNILLDPVLIFFFDFGIAGASLATLISHSIGFLVLLLMQRETGGLGHVRGRSLRRLGRILYTGLPSFLRQGLTCIAALCINRIAAAEGVAAVTAMSVVNRLFLLMFSFCAGVGQGMMPVAGYHFGAKNWEKVKRAYWAALLLSTAWMLLLSIPLLVYAPQILGFFRRESEVISIGSRALRAQAAVFVLHGVITCTILLLQAIGRQLGAILLACARQGFFFLPLLEWLPARFGGISFIYAQPIADILTFLLAVPFMIALLRKQKNRK
ncbi:MAG: MATE family efflux transporter [Clostridia bacterium]|nr:MATE family efflux transporter [Clostridia bacterium]